MHTNQKQQYHFDLHSLHPTNGSIQFKYICLYTVTNTGIKILQENKCHTCCSSENMAWLKYYQNA